MPINSQGTSIKLMCGGHGIAKIYCENKVIYSSGNTVTYYVDSVTVYREEVDEGASCLSPKTFTPAKNGWEFAGWRQDTAANGNVLSSLAMGDTPVTLYAVFRQTITLSYNGNSATSGSTAAQTGIRYYNNGNVANPSFTLRSNGFSRSGYTFSKWALGSASGTQYTAGVSVTLAASNTMYAVWTAQEYTQTLNGAGWTGPTVVQGAFSSGPSVGTRFDGGVELSGIGATALPYAIAEIYKTVETRGLSKATITFYDGAENMGSVSVGASSVTLFGKTSPVTISIDPSYTSQKLKISVNNGGDTYNWKYAIIRSIRFHN